METPAHTNPHRVESSVAHGIPRLEPFTVSFSLLALTLGAVIFAPWLSYPIGLLALYHTKKHARALVPFVLLIFSVGAAEIQSSRDFHADSSDFVNYHFAFTAICDSGSFLAGIPYFGPEIGLSLFYKAIEALGGCSLTITGLSFVQSLVVGLAFLLVMDKYVSEKIPRSMQAVALVAFAATLSFFYATQLSRQFISCIFLFHALFLSRRTRYKLGLLGIATLFHMTAPVIYVSVQVFRRYPLKWNLVAIMLLSILARLILSHAGDIAELLGISPLAAKFLYFDSTSDEGGGLILSDYMSALMLVIPGLAIYVGTPSRLSALRPEYRAMLAMGLFGLALTPFPLAATRFLLLYTQAVAGIYVSIWLFNTNRLVAYLLLSAIIVLKTFSYSGGAESATGLWFNYPAQDIVPAYPLAELVE